MRRLSSLLLVLALAGTLSLGAARAAHADYFYVEIVQVTSDPNADDPELGVNYLAVVPVENDPGDVGFLAGYVPGADGVLVQNVIENDDGTETDGDSVFYPGPDVTEVP